MHLSKELLLLPLDDHLQVLLPAPLQLGRPCQVGLDIVRPVVGGVEQLEVVAGHSEAMIEEEIDSLVNLIAPNRSTECRCKARIAKRKARSVRHEPRGVMHTDEEGGEGGGVIQIRAQY